MECCTQTLHGWFKHEALHRIGIRHGSECSRSPGLIEEIARGAWWAQGRRLRTGEVYR